MNAPLWLKNDVVKAVSGKASGPSWQANGVSIDSRSLGAGDLFVALAGPNHDGHDHVAAALEAGAAAALIHRRPANLPPDAPLIEVTDTTEALRALAAAARARSTAKIVAITGSVGKTGTKEMLKLALESAGSTHASAGNLNNHLGVPLSLSRLPADCRFAVFEMGMNHKGEISPLTRLVRPHVAVVTTVEAVHIEFFGTIAAIAEAKAEIFEGVASGGVALLPRDNPHYELLADAAKRAGIARIESFGSHIEASARLLDCGFDSTSTVVFALFGDHAISYRVGVPGKQWATNSLAALLAARAAGLDPVAAAQPLAEMKPPKGRGARTRIAWDKGEIELIDESYNASPVSMKSAIVTLAAAATGKNGRHIAVLGDMLELGTASAALHGGLADDLSSWDIDLVFAAGPMMRHLFDALPAAMQGGAADNSEALAPMVAAALKGGDVVMIKGSAGSRMGRVVEFLQSATGASRRGPI